ncbi:PAC2 family protein [Candidatus Woesearchaeota archaeon]|nr:PAC2 family protein [Candidatus Woesearchaeota archaeon]
MGTWKISLIPKRQPKLNKPILIEGLPGIGNVGKVAADFLIEELGAVKLYDIFSYTFPHSVFVNEDNLVELPTIELYYKKFEKGNDLLILAGDVQPIDEISSYKFSDKVLDILEEYHGKTVITLGGIGLAQVPKKPKVYCTGNNQKFIQNFRKETSMDSKLYGVVGPIVGVSGLLLGLAAKRNIDAISLLAETYGHPMYLGVKGAREIVKVLNKKLSLKIRLSKLDKEIEEMELEMMKKTEDLTKVSKQAALKKIKGKFVKDVNYIG